MMYSYDPKSESALRLAKVLKIKQIAHTDSKFIGDMKRTVLNWGCSDLPREVRRCKVINEENAVDRAINKLRFFQRMSQHGLSHVPFGTDVQWVRERLAAGARVFARMRLRGADGEGLVEVINANNIPQARLYTQYIPSEREYRITCVVDNEMKPQVVATQRKVRLDNPPPGGYNDIFRTTSGGYGFKWVTRGVPDAVKEVACASITNLGLHFGGVDVLWDGTNAYLLEVNTAPHLTPMATAAIATALAPHLNKG